MDADTGEVAGEAFVADLTVTFGTAKPGLLAAPGSSYAGVVEVLDIGLDLAGAPPVEALQDADVLARLPQLADESTKYRRGVLGVAAGSDAYQGAPVLTVGGALWTGVGMSGTPVLPVPPTGCARRGRKPWSRRSMAT